MTPTLILDCNALCHRARYAMKDKELSHDEMRTEVIFNFMNQILTLASELKSNKFVFVWDSYNNIRKKMFKGYKKRGPKDKTDEERAFDNLTIPQFGIIRREVLPAMGFKNIFIQTGVEADDIIASLVMNDKRPMVIVSQDNDLFQLLGYCNMYNYQTKKMLDRDKFIKEWGIEPYQWWEVKAIAGCRSDTVPGIEKVGEKTAIKYLLEELKESTKAYTRIKEGKKIIDRNVELVKLPLEITKTFKITKDEISTKKFLNVFEDLGFQMFLRPTEFVEWERLFKL